MTLLSTKVRLFKQVLPLFNALGDETRQQLVLHLDLNKWLSVNELTQLTDLSRPAVSHHLKVLRDAKLVVEYREGTKRYYRPTFVYYVGAMKQLIECIEQIEGGRSNGK